MSIFTILIILSGLSLGLLIDYMFLHHRFSKVEADLKDLRLKTGNEFLKIGREAKGIAEKDWYEIKNDAKKLETSARDEWDKISRDLDNDTEAVARGVVKEISKEDAAIVDKIVEEEKML